MYRYAPPTRRLASTIRAVRLRGGITSSPVRNFEPFGKGLLDTYAIACSLLMFVLFLALAIRRLDAQRLRG